MPDPTLTRRGVLGGASLATATFGSTLGIGALTELAADAAGNGPRGLQGALPRQVDVVVVGAGIAGLVAARQVARSGRSVLVVEARDRVGGRVLNHQLRQGGVIEAGGAFVGPTQDHILRLARRLEVPTFLRVQHRAERLHLLAAGRQEYYGTVPPDPTILPDALVLLNEIDSMAAEIDVSAPWAHPKAAQWDAITLGQFIRSRAVLNPGGVANLIKSWTQPGFGAEPGRALAPLHRLVRRLLRQRAECRHLRPQLRHRQRSSGATVRGRFAADPAADGAQARRCRGAAGRGDQDRAARRRRRRPHPPGQGVVQTRDRRRATSAGAGHRLVPPAPDPTQEPAAQCGHGDS